MAPKSPMGKRSLQILRNSWDLLGRTCCGVSKSCFITLWTEMATKNEQVIFFLRCSELCCCCCMAFMERSNRACLVGRSLEEFTWNVGPATLSTWIHICSTWHLNSPDARGQVFSMLQRSQLLKDIPTCHPKPLMLFCTSWPWVSAYSRDTSAKDSMGGWEEKLMGTLRSPRAMDFIEFKGRRSQNSL